MKFVFLALVLVVGVAASVMLLRTKKELLTHKKESASMRFEARDFPEHGVSFIVPSDPSFARLLSKSESTSIHDPYSVLLKNTGARAVVGYSIKWQCFDDRGEVPDRNLSNDRDLRRIVSWIFLHGEESDRRAALDRSEDIIKPHSIWFISFAGAARPIADLGGGDVVAPGTTQLDEGSRVESIQGCASITVIADGIFFDDGTFIGPDTIGFFTSVKSQLDARYEILRGVQDDLKSGKKADEIFKKLERIRDLEKVELGELPTAGELRSHFRSLFAGDVLGGKEYFGADKAIEDVQLQLSKPWVNLGKL